MNPFIIDESRERYHDHLNQAEQERQAQQACANRVNPVHRVRMHIGDYLIALGQAIKVPTQSEPQFDEAPPASV